MRILNERMGTQFTPQMLTHWNAWEMVGISKDDFFRTLDEAWMNWQTVKPTESELDKKLRRLRSFGEVDTVTGRSINTVSPARSWLSKQGILYDKFVRTQSTRAKAKLSYDVFVDDSAELMELIASRLDRWGILYSQPWNHGARNMPHISRVEKWDDVPNDLSSL